MPTEWTTTVCKGQRRTGRETGTIVGHFPGVARRLPEQFRPKRSTVFLLDGTAGGGIACAKVSGTETFVGSNRVDTNGAGVTLVAHGVRRRQTAFVGIENGKGYVKALRHDLATGLVGIGRDSGGASSSSSACVSTTTTTTTATAAAAAAAAATVQDDLSETGDFALHRVLADAPLQIMTVPFDFHVHDTFQDAIDAFHNGRELNVWVCVERERERGVCVSVRESQSMLHR
jgi:hypothetical protein